MTPAINIAKQHNIRHQVHEYEHDPSNTSYGTEAAEKLGLPESRVFKTLVVCIDSKALAVAVIPVNAMLSMKLVAKALGAKKAVMADKKEVERTTGYVLGGVSPLGQKRSLNTIIDHSADSHDTIFVSAGRRGLEIELSPSDLEQLTRGKLDNICQ